MQKVADQEGKAVHSFHHDPLQHSLLCLVRYEAHIHSFK